MRLVLIFDFFGACGVDTPFGTAVGFTIFSPPPLNTIKDYLNFFIDSQNLVWSRGGGDRLS